MRACPSSKASSTQYQMVDAKSVVCFSQLAPGNIYTLLCTLRTRALRPLHLALLNDHIPRVGLGQLDQPHRSSLSSLPLLTLRSRHL